MDRLLTHPHWMCVTPASLRPRGENYWSAAELPLSTEWVFIVNLLADETAKEPPRSILIAGMQSLLSVVEEVGVQRLGSIYQIWFADADDTQALEVNRVSAVHVGQDAKSGGQIYYFETATGKSIYDKSVAELIEGLVNRIEVIRVGKR